MSSSSHRANLTLEHERVAQLVEHRPFKALVLGSSPSPLTTHSKDFISGLVVFFEGQGVTKGYFGDTLPISPPCYPLPVSPLDQVRCQLVRPRASKGLRDTTKRQDFKQIAVGPCPLREGILLPYLAS
jgi:hypothetical protein